jgi:hypothetical protein
MIPPNAANDDYDSGAVESAMPCAAVIAAIDNRLMVLHRSTMSLDTKSASAGALFRQSSFVPAVAQPFALLESDRGGRDRLAGL